LGRGQKNKPRGRKISMGQSYMKEDSKNKEVDEVKRLARSRMR
jgi:hypothetical protein